MDLLTDPHSIIDNLSSLKIDSKRRSTTKKLWPAQSNKLKVLQAFSIFTNKPNDPLTLLKWTTTTPEDFDSFQFHDYRPYDYGPLVPNSNATQNNNNEFDSTYIPPTEASIFQRSIKRDPNNFQKLKDNKQWIKWHIHTRAQANTQHVDEILDPQYVPLGQDATDFYHLKQKYSFAVFTDILLTDKGKSLVRKHHNTGNVQLNFKELVEHTTDSTNTSVEYSDLL